jgi:hypothetical protein
MASGGGCVVGVPARGDLAMIAAEDIGERVRRRRT